MNALDPSGTDRREGAAGGVLKLLALITWAAICGASGIWLVLVLASVVRGNAGAGLLVIAPIPALLCGIAVVGVRAAADPLRGRFRALDRRRAVG